MRYNNEENTCILIRNEDTSVSLFAKKISKIEYVIYDKDENLHQEILTNESFQDFLDGRFEINDIDGNSWNFSKQPVNQKASISDLITFICQDI